MTAATAIERPYRVGDFATAREAHAAIEALLADGFTRDELAVVCPDARRDDFADIPQPKPPSDYTAQAIGVGTAAGAVLGGIALAAATLASGGLAAPAAGAVLMGGGAISGAFVGAMSGRVAEKELGPYFEQSIRQGHILVAVELHGEDSGPRLAKAERILSRKGGDPVALPEG